MLGAPDSCENDSCKIPTRLKVVCDDSARGVKPKSGKMSLEIYPPAPFDTEELTSDRESVQTMDPSDKNGDFVETLDE